MPEANVSCKCAEPMTRLSSRGDRLTVKAIENQSDLVVVEDEIK
eukprot:CAMPEP_0174740464 /NCGR_PEP_ID=MMETSP1094-20130205/73651_1 /TAXON_ID=156173 /ORGANISM="Chrysochromulina brevifilum, Strain UTEX LB 985" /LENGTH=43 /DNA_ID= /DNA_START= /DNA_END= /DNA_ORIENTATION=